MVPTFNGFDVDLFFLGGGGGELNTSYNEKLIKTIKYFSIC